MVQIEYHKNFIKNFKKRFSNSPKIHLQYRSRLKLFILNPDNFLLKDHQLTGNKLSLRAFSVSGDVRVVYKKIGRRIVFLDIGTHNQVY